MKRIKFTFIFITLSVLVSAQDKTAMLDSLYATIHQRGQFNGNVLVARHGNIVYENSFGLANRETGKKLNDSTLFNTGSVSKAFTAIAIQQLAEEGQLHYSDPVQKHLDDFPYPAVTIHHLLVHASGLPMEYELPPGWDHSKMATNEEVLSVLYKEKPELEFTTGEKAKYSNLGYMVLAEIVEAISNMTFDAYLEKNIFNPARMEKTSRYNAEEIKKVENVANGYLFYPFTGQYEQAITIPEFSSNYAISGLKGDGNIYSTVSDLYRFYEALKNGKLISRESLNTTFEKHSKSGDAHGNSFGYGWTIANAPEPVELVQRGGELPGYVSNIIWDVGRDELLIYLINDYLAYVSYHKMIYPAYAGVIYSNKLQIPKLMASVELTKIAPTASLEEIEQKIDEIKHQPELYEIDVPGLKFLVKKLKELNQAEKAQLMMQSFGPGRN